MCNRKRIRKKKILGYFLAFCFFDINDVRKCVPWKGSLGGGGALKINYDFLRETALGCLGVASEIMRQISIN